MKRVFSVFAAMVILVSVCGCSGGESVSVVSNTVASASQNTSSQTAATSVETTSSKATASSSQRISSKKENKTSVDQKKTSKPRMSSAEETPPDYSLLSCRQVAYGQWETIQIHHSSTNIRLQLDIPADWTLSSQNSHTWNIKRSGKVIGVMTTRSLPEPKDYFDTWGGGSEQKCIDGVRQINWHKENGKDAFYRFFQFNCTPEGKSFSLRFRVNYTELDEEAAGIILDNAFTVPEEEAFVPLSQTNGSKNILILGNSFIRSSQIGVFLNDMLDAAGSDYQATAVSVGMAEVQTFTRDSELCEAIRNGEYGYLFQCGFYSKEAVAALGTMKRYCDASNTPLVIFPAHNEGESLIEEAHTSYDDVCLLNWKGEINALINTGVSYDDFCVNDYHKHSTPLAGYVGAHMIYQTLFGEAPPAITSASPLTMNELRSKLGMYVDKGNDYFAFTGKTYEID